MYKHGRHKVTLNETIYRFKGEENMSQDKVVKNYDSLHELKIKKSCREMLFDYKIDESNFLNKYQNQRFFSYILRTKQYIILFQEAPHPVKIIYSNMTAYY